ETVARIDEEVEAFKTRLASPEAQKGTRGFPQSEALAIGSASFASVGIKQVVGIVSFAKRALLAELESCVALFERGLSVVIAETGHRRLTVRRSCRLVQIQEALTTAATTLIFNREGLRGGHRIHCS